MAALDKHDPAYADRNPFLLALLGSLRLAGQFERMIERTSRLWHGAKANENDTLYAVMGALHLAQRVRAAGAFAPPVGPDTPASGRDLWPPDSLLR